MADDGRIVEAIERLAVEAVGLTTIALTEASPGIELSLPQWRVIVVVGGRAGGTRIGEIASRVGSAVPTTSRLVRRLERRGFVVAERDDTDRRATLVRLTAAGEQIRQALVDRRRELIQTALLHRSLPLAGDLALGLEQIGEALDQYG